MNKYKVTIGDESTEVEAENTREARRRAMEKVVPGVGLMKVEKVGEVEEAPKKLYKVTWGDQCKEVIAVHEDDAWSQFVGGDEDSIAYKYPQTHERILEELGVVEDDRDTGATSGVKAKRETTKRGKRTSRVPAAKSVPAGKLGRARKGQGAKGSRASKKAAPSARVPKSKGRGKARGAKADARVSGVGQVDGA